MNKFVLFGDSYVDPLKVNAGECWSDLLARDAEVVNYGKSGTGPDYSLDLLENFIDKEFKGYEVVVFFIGFPCRFNFTDIPHPGHAVDVSNIHYWGSGRPLHGNLHFDRWHEENEDHIEFYYKNSPIQRFTEFHLGYLRNLSDIRGVRMIAVLQENPFVHPKYRCDNPEEWSVPIPEKVSNLLDSKHFTVYPYNIASVSRKEFRTMENDTTGRRDTRQNHLTNKNHVVLYKNIISILEHEPTKEHILFREDFDTWYKPHTGFIYDE